MRAGCISCLSTHMKIEHKFHLSSAIILVIMLLTLIIPFKTTSWVRSTQNDIARIQDISKELEHLLSLIKDAETGQRGFVITGKEPFLESYYSALGELSQARKSLKRLASGSKELERTLEKVAQLVDGKMASISETIEVRREQGFAAAQMIVAGARGKEFMDQLRHEIGSQLSVNAVQAERLHVELHERSTIANIAQVGATVFNVLLLVFLLYFMFRLLKQRQETSNDLRQAGERLTIGMAEIERRNQDISTISQMTQALDSTQSTIETCKIIALYCQRLLPGTSGALYLFRNSRDLLEKDAQWGNVAHGNQVIQPDECWALRRGQPHHAENTLDLCCSHYDAQMGELRHLCIPLTAQGNVLGLVYIEMPLAIASQAPHQQTLAIAVSEQMALALANARLRDVLRHQSIVDPLTGLYNRRYMDETLKRELALAKRNEKPLTLIVLDIDHFKKVNDTYGHEAGDTVLIALAEVLKKEVRESDLACRFGGEELVLILPDCSAEVAMKRAESVRLSISRLDIHYKGQRITQVTASFGIAVFPEHGATPEHLFQEADQALYTAKHNGRNMVMLAA